MELFQDLDPFAAFHPGFTSIKVHSDEDAVLDGNLHFHLTTAVGEDVFAETTKRRGGLLHVICDFFLYGG